MGLARRAQAERDAAPDAGVRGVTDVRALGEARAHAAGAVVDAHGPDAAALALEADLEGQVDTAGAILADHEGERLEHRARRGPGEAPRVDPERLEPALDPPAPDREHHGLERAPLLGRRVERAPPVRDGRDEALRRELAQARREHARRDPGALAQLLEAERRGEELAQQHQGPAVADRLERPRHRVEDPLRLRNRGRRPLGGAALALSYRLHLDQSIYQILHPLSK